MKAFWIKFWLRFFAVCDVLTVEKFDLQTWDKTGRKTAKTTFWKTEIEDVNIQKKYTESEVKALLNQCYTLTNSIDDFNEQEWFDKIKKTINENNRRSCKRI